MKALLLLSLVLTGSAQALSPREAARLSASETASRDARRPGRVLLTVGLQELRDQSPQSLVQMDLQVPVWSTFALALQAMVPTKRKELTHYLGGAVHWYERPRAGLWVSVGAGRYLFRTASAQTDYTSGRMMVGWRWRPKNEAGSFGISLGPEASKAGAKTVWGAVFRFDVGADFSPASLFQ